MHSDIRAKALYDVASSRRSNQANGAPHAHVALRRALTPRHHMRRRVGETSFSLSRIALEHSAGSGNLGHCLTDIHADFASPLFTVNRFCLTNNLDYINTSSESLTTLRAVET